MIEICYDVKKRVPTKAFLIAWLIILFVLVLEKIVKKKGKRFSGKPRA